MRFDASGHRPPTRPGDRVSRSAGPQRRDRHALTVSSRPPPAAGVNRSAWDQAPAAGDGVDDRLGEPLGMTGIGGVVTARG